MATYKALPAAFGRIHPKFRTPRFATIFMSVVAIAFYIGMTLVSENILSDTILSLGLAIAFYYAITAYACVWYFRREIFTTARDFFFKGLFPLLGGLMLTAAFIQSAIDMYNPDYGYTVIFGIGGVFVIGVGALAVGAVLMLVWFFFPGSKSFYRGESLNRETEVLVPEEEPVVLRSVDGGLM
jgi:amino acid transporter